MHLVKNSLKIFSIFLCLLGAINSLSAQEIKLVKSLKGAFSFEYEDKKAEMNYTLDIFGENEKNPTYAKFSTTINSSDFGDDLKPDFEVMLPKLPVRCPCFIFGNEEFTISFPSDMSFPYDGGLDEVQSIKYNNILVELK
jgi:hypothetical protein